MRLPSWYKAIVLFWLAVVVPFSWFATAFNGVPFFALPIWASSSEGAGWQSGLVVQIAICAAMVAPFVLLPVALIMRRRNISNMAHHAPNH